MRKYSPNVYVSLMDGDTQEAIRADLIDALTPSDTLDDDVANGMDSHLYDLRDTIDIRPYMGPWDDDAMTFICPDDAIKMRVIDCYTGGREVVTYELNNTDELTAELTDFFGELIDGNAGQSKLTISATVKSGHLRVNVTRK